MLTIYRRHLKTCDHRAEGRSYRRCRCPLWVDGFLGKDEIRESLRTRNWDQANEILHEWEANGRVPAEPRQEEQLPPTIQQVCKEFILTAESRKLKKTTVDRYRIIFRQLDAFAAGQGLRFFNQVDTRALNQFRATWKGDSGLADLKKLERLRAFFKYAVSNGYTDKNYAQALQNPKIRQTPTAPFEQDEMLRILATASQNITERKGQAKLKALRTRALVLLLRYAGLRISDGVGCAIERVQDGKLWLYTAKTGQHVYVPLPAFVVKELERVPRASERFWFWTGVGSLETARKKWSEALANLFTAAKVQEGHAHRLRDTFAVELLKTGVPIERVSILLGHSSVKITEKHYNPWKSRPPGADRTRRHALLGL